MGKTFVKSAQDFDMFWSGGGRDIGVRRERANDALDANIRFTTAKRRVLMQQMEAFRWPVDGAWTETHAKGPGDAVLKVKCSLPAEKRAELLDINGDD